MSGKGTTMTGILASYSYVELLDMLGQLNRYSPNHELIPWVEQEIELREILMDRQMEAMHEYAERCRDELL